MVYLNETCIDVVIVCFVGSKVEMYSRILQKKLHNLALCLKNLLDGELKWNGMEGRIWDRTG